MLCAAHEPGNSRNGAAGIGGNRVRVSGVTPIRLLALSPAAELCGVVGYGYPWRMGERIGWLDTARAIGIVAVVAGHVTTDRAIWAAMFHFHMPLFFMLSGMTFSPAPPHVVAARRARTLLVPYAAWLVLVALGDIAIAAATGHPTYLPWDRPIAAVARALLGGTYLVGPFGIFWFVTCLFLVQIAAGAILRRPDARSPR